MTMTDYASYLQNEQIRQAANDNATQAYNQAKLAGESEDRALAATKFAWQQTMDRAGLTGRFEDSWTMPTQQWFTQQFGTWMPGGPQAGQQTLTAQQQAYAQAMGLTNAFGQYYAPGQTPGAGTQTLAGQAQQWGQGFQTWQEQARQEQQRQQVANQYLTLLSNLRGPADWAKYQEVLGSTPGGLQNLVAAAMGQYVPGGGATTGVQPQAANLNTLMAQVQSGNAQAPYQPSTGVQMPGATGGAQPQQAANVAAFTPGGNNLVGGGGNTVQWTNETAAARGDPYATQLGTQPQPGQVPPNVQAQQQYQAMPPAAGNGTNTMGAPQNQMNLPAPNQVAAQSWNNLTPSQKEMMKGQWESQGWYKPDVEALMNQALPKYASNAATAGTWRLR